MQPLWRVRHFLVGLEEGRGGRVFCFFVGLLGGGQFFPQALPGNRFVEGRRAQQTHLLDDGLELLEVFTAAKRFQLGIGQLAGKPACQ